MHPELISALATEHRRDLSSQLATPAHRTPAHRTRTHRTRTHRGLLPRYKLTWTRTKVAAATAGRRGSSVVIVISATRAL